MSSRCHNAGTSELPQSGIRGALVAVDHRPQAHWPAVPDVDYVFLFHRRLLRVTHPPGTVDSGGRPGTGGYLQQALHHARQGDGLLFLIPSIPAVLGNFLVPIMIGAKDLAFPRINLLSWYMYMVAGLIMLHCIMTGGVDTGWTFYTPFSTAFRIPRSLKLASRIFIAGFSSILTGLNFIVTVHRMRAPGMTWSRLPLFVWSNTPPASSWCSERRCSQSLYCWLSSSGIQPRHLRSRRSAATRCCSSTCSGSIRIRRCTS